MLPQFGYIVAQAGADARLPAPAGPPSGLPPPPQHNSTSNPISNQYRHDTSSGTPPRDRPYFPRHSSPAPHPPPTPSSSSSSSSMPPPPPVLPPPIPFMYASSDYNYQHPYYPGHSAVVPHTQPPPSAQQQQQQIQAQPPPPPPPQTIQHQQQPPPTSSTTSFRPLPPKWRDEPQQLTQHHAPPATVVTTTSPFISQQRPETPPATSSVWHAPTPPPQQQQKQSSSTSSSAAASSFHPASSHDLNYDYDPYHSQYESQWDQDDQGGKSSETHQNKKMRSLRECNDLLTTMNNEFLEHSTVIYHNKLQSLQEELRSIQEGTHEAFMEEIADLEKQREEAIFNAQCLMEYHVSGLKRRYETDVNAAEQDYELERQNLHDTIVAAIIDRRQQVKEDRDNGFDVKDLFRDAYHRVNNSKRNLRKRHHFDHRSTNASPSRHDNTRRRQNRPSNMYSINGPIPQREEDDLDQEFAVMKGLKRQTAAA